MTEVFKHIQDFFADTNLPGNLAAIVGVIATVVLAILNKFIKAKAMVAAAKATKKEAEVADMMDKMSKAMLCLSNMFAVTFNDSKVKQSTKIFLSEKHDEMFEILGGLVKDVKKEKIEIKPEVVEVKELKEEKSVLDKIKEDL